MLLLGKVQGLISFNWTMLMVFITFLVLFLIMKKFFFEKIHNFMMEREQKVRDSFEEADSVNAAAEKRLREYSEKLEGAEAERKEILLAAKSAADENAREIVARAEKRAADLIAKAEAEIERDRLRAAADMREQIAMLSLFAAEKIIEKNLSAADQSVIIDKAIQDAAGSRWKI